MESKNEEKLENTTENNDRKGYFREYNKKRYKNNKELLKRYRNTANIKKKYQIEEVYVERYGPNLHNVIKSIELLRVLDDNQFEQFIEDFHNIRLDKL